ncbi:DUF1553 domain-containing protein [Roseimaritima ulvae]|uniref:Cytochrome c domain-containing protein n=1 Tax=Roseimaritima ulvae TaxID=980254 RepID=A0A5B9QKR4_9BACT|nr:DUF1553 domain-containing protein [Roseimaritima ulvae]QEG38342.1 hypothetical protein UC8_02990 [Roseimaritima ulvae]
MAFWKAPLLKSLAQWGLFAAVGLTAFGYIASGLGKPQRAEARVAAIPASQSQSIQATVDDLNAEFQRHWHNRDVQPAPTADWQTICRRMSLSLVGSGLSVEEMRYLQSLPEQQRTQQCLDRLLADERFEDYWSERLTRSFVGAEEGPFIVFRRRRFVTWIRDQLHNNRPYDQMIREMITARGLWNDQPQVNFLTVTLDSGEEEGQVDVTRLASRTSRAFLGMRIDCLQCHDDFLGNVSLGTASESREGTQQDFHQLAAFFAVARFNGLQGIADQDHTYEYQYLDADEAVAVPPKVPFQEDLVDENLPVRQQLAHWMTHPENRQSARAAVNRVWALLLGKAMTDPVDDIPLHGPLPPGMDRLADDFVAHGWNLRRLIRVIVSSDVYQRDSRAPFEVTERHEQAWALFPVTRLRPEQVAGSVIQASRVKTLDSEGSFLMQLQKLTESNDFVKRYGDSGEDEFDLDAVTITQRLLMLNGNLVSEHTKQNPVLNACTHIAMFATNDEQAVETAYLAVLNRSPSERERETFVARLADGNRRQAIEDMYWVLLNSSELGWNH